jgi:hypothetical protein
MNIYKHCLWTVLKHPHDGDEVSRQVVDKTELVLLNFYKHFEIYTIFVGWINKKKKKIKIKSNKKLK